MAIGAFASSHSQPEPVIKAASLSGQSFKARNLVQHIFGEEPSLIDTLRRPLEDLPQSIQDLQRLVQADLRAQCQNLATSSTLLDRQLKRLVKRWGNSELRAKYQEEFQGYYQQLKEQYPQSSKALLKKAAHKLCSLHAAQKCTETVELFPDKGKQFVRDFARDLKQTEILFYALDVGVRVLYAAVIIGMSYLALQVADKVGFFSKRYHLATENQKCENFAEELADAGYHSQAKLFRKPDLFKTLREDVFDAFGYQPQEYEGLHANQSPIKNVIMYESGLNTLELPFFGPYGTVRAEPTVPVGSCIAEYDERYQIIEFHNPAKITETLVRHELTHSIVRVDTGIRGQTSGAFISPYDILDEGAALYAEDRRLDLYTSSGVSFALFTLLLGHDSANESINPQQQFERGKRIFAQSFISDHNIDSVRQTLDSINGSGTYERLFVEPFGRAGGRIRFVAALVSEFERTGYNIDSVIGSWSPTYMRTKQLSGEINAIASEIEYEENPRELMRELIDSYRGSQTADFLSIALIEHLQLQQEVSEEDLHLSKQLAHQVIADGREGYWRLTSQLYLLRHGSQEDLLAINPYEKEILLEYPNIANMIEFTFDHARRKFLE